jgi:hypothetical protein
LVASSNAPPEHATHASWLGVCRNPGAHQHSSMPPAPATDVEFAGHAAHALAPTALLYVPAPHSVQTLAPAAAENAPAAHGAQALAAAAPAAAENVPAAHDTHALSTAEPAAAEYFPAPQATQVLATEAPAAAENIPAAQSVHATEPAPVLYFPATHALHAPPSGPENPALQTQLVTAGEAVGDSEFAGQLLQ